MSSSAPRKMPITDYELRITNLKLCLRIFVILCALGVFAADLYAQENKTNLTIQEIDWLATASFLYRSLADGTNEQKRDALLQIKTLKTEEASRLAIPALKDDAEIVRATAASSVVFLPADEAATLLVSLLADKKPLVRREAAYALGAVGSASAIHPLLRVLQRDKDAEVRSAAVAALGAIGDASAVSELVKILQRRPQAKEEFLKRSAARAIGQIAQTIQTGKRQVVTPESFLPDNAKSHVQPQFSSLVEAFPQFRPAISALIQTLGDAREAADVKREAAFALGAIGDASAVAILQQNAAAADYYLAEISRESLRKIAAAASR